MRVTISFFVLSTLLFTSCKQKQIIIADNKITVTTIAGTGQEGYTDGPAKQAAFKYPQGVVVDSKGNVFVGDLGNNKVRKITPQGIVETVASIPAPGPNALVLDSKGNLIICALQVIYKLTPDNKLSRLAGTGEMATFADGPAEKAAFWNAGAITIDAYDNIYVADYGHQLVRKISNTGIVSTIGAKPGEVIDVYAKESPPHFEFPTGVAADSKGNIFIVECYKNRILKITPHNEVSIFAGNGEADSTDGAGNIAGFNFPHGLAIDSHDNIYVADQGNNKIRMITPDGIVTTLAGNGDYASDDGEATIASFNGPEAVSTGKDGEVYVAEKDGNRIRKITFNYEAYIKSRLDTLKTNNHHYIQDTISSKDKTDTTTYHLPYRDTSMEAFGADYIDTFTEAGIPFRIIHINNERKRDNTATVEKLTNGNWIMGLTFTPQNHEGDFHHNTDVNNDGYIDITHELRFTSEAFLFDVSKQDFQSESNVELNYDILLIDSIKSIFCDYQEYKGMCGQVTSTLYTFNGLNKKDLYQMTFYNCDSIAGSDSITKIIIQRQDINSDGKIVEEIQLKQPVEISELESVFDYRSYWRKNYKRLLGYK